MEWCRRPRPHGCRHACPWPCHFEPCPPCFDEVQVQCYCEQTMLTYSCCEVLSWPDVDRTEVENPFLRCIMPCHKSYGTCSHMCVAKCHFGPCPPCGRKDVTAKCRCGKVKRQLPCSEVWQNGIQLFLECTDDCLTNQAAVICQSAEVDIRTDGEKIPAGEPAESGSSLASTTTDLRERRREKQRKREEEMEERRGREEAAKRRKQFIQNLHLAARFGGVALFLCIYAYMVIVLGRDD